MSFFNFDIIGHIGFIFLVHFILFSHFLRSKLWSHLWNWKYYCNFSSLLLLVIQYWQVFSSPSSMVLYHCRRGLLFFVVVLNSCPFLDECDHLFLSPISLVLLCGNILQNVFLGTMELYYHHLGLLFSPRFHRCNLPDYSDHSFSLPITSRVRFGNTLQCLFPITTDIYHRRCNLF